MDESRVHQASEQVKKGRILSFKYALEGLVAAFHEEPHLKFHCLAAVLVMLAGLYFGISRTEWVALLITIGMVMTLELTNAAIEAVVDSFTDKYHPTAKFAKDISAGAVLIGAIISIIVGILIFWPYL